MQESLRIGNLSDKELFDFLAYCRERQTIEEKPHEYEVYRGMISGEVGIVYYNSKGRITAVGSTCEAWRHFNKEYTT